MGNGQGDDFGDLVGVEFANGRFQRGVARLGGLDQQWYLDGLLDLAFPLINRAAGRQEVHAGGQAPGDKGVGNLLGGFRVGAVGQDSE